jgi:hypothetical protein
MLGIDAAVGAHASARMITERVPLELLVEVTASSVGAAKKVSVHA